MASATPVNIDRRCPTHKSLAVAWRGLFEDRTPAVGMTTPDITGEDVKDLPLPLPDFHGREVVLDYTHEDCGDCRLASSRLRSHVEGMCGRRLFILGVDDNHRRDVPREAATRGR